ncbi:MAG: arsenate reductase ArsC [Hyphomicrobiales bacterium]|nr:arsenate reductase ArsC [Hyphomicrobiales bacterium]
MSDRGFNVLILCTGNSARSVLAEALLNHMSAEAGVGIKAFSAGSRPKLEVHPGALKVLKAKGIGTTGLRSKSWDEFASSSAPRMDVVITVCNSAAGETCPIWPGSPARVHWGLDDPAAVVGSQKEVDAAFRKTFDELKGLIGRLVDVAITSQDRGTLQARIQEINLAAA